MAPIHWETDLREAYASLRGVKGSLRGGVLFGVAYAGGYARIFCQQVWRSQLWGNFVYRPRSGFITFHFGLLWLHLLLWGTYGWGSQLLTQDLRGGYAVLTRGELVASDKCIQMYSNSQLQGHQILQESQSLIFENIISENPLTQVCLRNDLSSTDTRSAYAAYATMWIFRYCTYALFF